MGRASGDDAAVVMAMAQRHAYRVLSRCAARVPEHRDGGTRPANRTRSAALRDGPRASAIHERSYAAQRASGGKRIGGNMAETQAKEKEKEKVKTADAPTEAEIE